MGKRLSDASVLIRRSCTGRLKIGLTTKVLGFSPIPSQQNDLQPVVAQGSAVICRGLSVGETGDALNALIIDSLAAEIERVRADKDFTSRARELLKRDKELLDRLAR